MYHQSQNNKQNNKHHDTEDIRSNVSDNENHTYNHNEADCCYNNDNYFYLRNHESYYLFDNQANNDNSFQCRPDYQRDNHTYHDSYNTDNIETYGADNDIPDNGAPDRHHIRNYTTNQPHYTCHKHDNRNHNNQTQHTDHNKHRNNCKYHL